MRVTSTLHSHPLDDDAVSHSFLRGSLYHAFEFEMCTSSNGPATAGVLERFYWALKTEE